METLLQDIHFRMASSHAFPDNRVGLAQISSSQEALSISASHQSQQRSPDSTSNPQNLQNAVLESMHTSTTESILEWSHFDAFPSLRHIYVSIFHLEHTRPPITMKASTMYPYVNSTDIDDIVKSFEHSVNFWYPTLSRSNLDAAQSRICAGAVDESTSSCLAFLIMALGCASQTTSGLAAGSALTKEEAEYHASRRAMADMYMDGVLKRLHVVHMEMSATATQCLFFIAIYFAFLRRPLQAWEYINSAATKCRLLLTYTPSNGTQEDQECMRRIFWSCYILESDYVAELSALPPSGIAQIESSIPLPGQYNTHSNVLEEEQSSLYFLACISMRRLLNRVHHVLYAQGSGVSLDNARFPYIVSEFDHQLEEWREFLPAAFSFSVDTQETATEHGGFLRQRYLTCRSVIYRPYLTWVLASCGETTSIPESVHRSCKSCLDACLLHILNLRGFAHTVLVDTWICSLSMTGAMLVLLAACQLPALRHLVGEEVLTAGPHLTHLIQTWTVALGEPSSPSVDQSVRLICETDSFIQQMYHS